jgi:hypothetical protein
MEPQLVLPLCLNHAGTPGEVREVHPCECCRNFEARHETSRPPVPADPEVKYIPLGGDQFAIVDAADFEWLKRYEWRFFGGEGGRGYAYRVERGQKIFMHREIMQTPPGQVAHHENHNPIDNRRGNLRNCKPQENQHHRRRARNRSGFVGVSPHGKKWRARIESGGRLVYCQVFADKVEAAKARDRKAYELFGPFAYLNFPDEIRREPAPNSAPPVLRFVDLSGSARVHCRAVARLTVIRAAS